MYILWIATTQLDAENDKEVIYTRENLQFLSLERATQVATLLEEENYQVEIHPEGDLPSWSQNISNLLEGETF